MYKTGLQFSLVDRRASGGDSSWSEYVVLCRSDATLGARAQPSDSVPQDSALVGRIHYVDARTPDGWLRGMSETDQARLVATSSIELGDGWVAWKLKTFRISLDRCATWLEFVPWKAIPYSEVMLSGRPCGDEECARLGFERQIAFQQFRVERHAKSPASNRISFTLRADSLADSNLRG
jgi:hypothetical protein